MGEGKIYWAILDDVDVEWDWQPLGRDDLDKLSERMKRFWGSQTVHVGMVYLDLMSEDFEVYPTFVGEHDFQLTGVLVPVVSPMGDSKWFYFAHDAEEWIIEAKDKDPNLQTGMYDFYANPSRQLYKEAGTAAQQPLGLGVYKEAIEMFYDYYGMDEPDPSDEEDDIIGDYMGRNE